MVLLLVSLVGMKAIVQAATGLVGEWKFDEGGGSIAADTSGNNNTGNLINNPSWVTGKNEKALEFNGSSNYVEIAPSDSLNSFNSKITIMAWVKTDFAQRYTVVANWYYDKSVTPVVGKRAFVCLSETGADTGKFNFGLSPKEDGTGQVWLKSKTAVPANQWVHLAWVSDGATMSIYVNGSLDVSVAGPSVINQSNHTVHIGVWNNKEASGPDLNGYFKGLIDGLKIYNRSLTAEEVVTDYLVGAVTGKISGKITSAGQPLAGAKVITYLGAAASETNGDYTLANLAVGNYSVRAFKGGYQSSQPVAVTVTENTTQTANFELKPAVLGNVIIWDTTKDYTMKNPFPSAYQDKANWVQVPYGTTDYVWIGDPLLENKYFYLFLFSNEEDSPDLTAKLNDGSISGNEIYKVHDTSLRNFGMGRMWTKILNYNSGEILVEAAEKGKRFGTPIPITNTYRIINKPWLEIKPVLNMNQQGMHSKSRLGAFVYTDRSKDVVLDGRKHVQVEENIYPSAGCLGLMNFHRSNGKSSGQDFLWFLTFPAGAEINNLTYQGIHYPDPYWEWDNKPNLPPGDPAAPSVGANYAYLKEKVVIGTLGFGDNWKRIDVKKNITAGETYVSTFTVTYSGKWRFAAAIDADWNITGSVSETELTAGDKFTFISPKSGYLDYLVLYMWDRNAGTPSDIYTPMDVYRSAILGVDQPKTVIVSINTPQNSEDVLGVVPIEVSASGSSAISAVDFYVDDRLKYTDNTPPYQWLWDTKSVVNGQHRIKAVAYDSESSSGEQTIMVTVNNPGGEPAAQGEGVSVYPNPYIKGRNSRAKITFSSLPRESVLKIFAVSGELIKTIEHKDTIDGGKEDWDVSNVPGGVYVYTIDSSAGMKKGKISIIK